MESVAAVLSSGSGKSLTRHCCASVSGLLSLLFEHCCSDRDGGGVDFRSFY